ncbi:lysophospholipase [bacterium]|nr:lysophospholipase [bacterium]
MRIEEQQLEFRGHHLHRLILHPEGLPKGNLIFFHGQGDFIDRYPPVLEAFTHHGLTCVLTDLPGHGRSSGMRGHVPSSEFVDALFEKTLCETVGPHSIAGHSMGGMLALRAFLKSPQRFKFAWFSSPLLEPSRQGHPLIKITLPVIASLFPWITWSTGVKADDCRTGGSDEPREDSEAAPLYHSKISLGWAKELIAVGKELENTMLSLPSQPPILFSQGSADSICPAEILKQRLEKLPIDQVSYQEIEGALHEPFAGESAEEFEKILKAFAQKVS